MSETALPGLKRDVALAPYTTLKIGGPADYFIEVRTEDQLVRAADWSGRRGISRLVIGSGSNLLVSNRGFSGLVIRNSITGIRQSGQRLMVKGGTLLQDLVNFANRAGLQGLEKMTGIPGTLAGAIYGNAGAYGQTISDRLTQVRVFDGRKVQSLSRSQGLFSYRESIFKERKELAILEAEFVLAPAEPKVLQAASRKIRALREAKYPTKLKCPGSFFKNLRREELPPEILANIPKEKIIHGKIPAGYLLEAVGANGKSRGSVRIASYHGNLFFNSGGGTAEDFLALAKEYRRRVKEKFGILLEPEVQLIGFGLEGTW
uniref:UDP-N-acetylenolpyruvoylglucosamine reductase n=1 Tax=candidate division WWE3 bacterium TaxID=2053526 RepID=A0A832E0M8_UNCKA